MATLEQGEYTASIDLSEAYLHILIRPKHQRCLRFCYRIKHYHYSSFVWSHGSSSCLHEGAISTCSQTRGNHSFSVPGQPISPESCLRCHQDEI